MDLQKRSLALCLEDTQQAVTVFFLHVSGSWDGTDSTQLAILGIRSIWRCMIASLPGLWSLGRDSSTEQYPKKITIVLLPHTVKCES